MEKEIERLREQLESDDWDTIFSSANRLAEIDSLESTSILLDMLKSTNPNVRNLAAIAMRASKNQKYFEPLIRRINELGHTGQIGSLVYALEALDCSRSLYDIAKLNLNAGTNLEVKDSTTLILNEQEFSVTKDELERINQLLSEFNFNIEGFDVNYKVVES